MLYFREVLTEDNPWFCPQCQRNQVSIKTMTVSRWPDILIVHLKRYVHAQYGSDVINIANSHNKTLSGKV